MTPIADTFKDDKPALDNTQVPKNNYNKFVKTYMHGLFKSDNDRKEAYYVIIGAAIIALNTGFVNGVSMSPYFLSESNSVVETEFKVNPASQPISGTGGSFTRSAMSLVENDWPNYSYFTFLLSSYIFGAFICGLITPRRNKHILEPTYGPTFFIAALFLLASSLFASYGLPSRFIFYFATAALGVQNGIASIYSANLIRCTLTGTSTDLGLIFAEALRGNFERCIRGTLIAIIVCNYWIGGVISVPVVKSLKERSLYISVVFFVLLGCLCLIYTVRQFNLSVYKALTGKWDYKEILEDLFNNDGVNRTRDDFMKLFEELDVNDDGLIAPDDIQTAIEKSKTITMTPFQAKALMRAADTNHDNCLDVKEWGELVNKVVKN